MKQNMKTRIITGAVLMSALAFAIIMGGWVFSVICILCIGIALHEMMHALRQHGHQIVRWPVWAATVASIPCFLMWQNRLLMTISVVTCLIIVAYVLFHGEPKLEDIVLSVMPFLAVSLPGMCLLAQINAPLRWQQVMLLCTSFLVPTMGDTAAYFVGSRFGKHKLIPAVSPNKTTEGAVAGLLGSVLTGMVIHAITHAFVPAAELAYLPPMWHFVIIGLLGGFAGQLGDLFASLVKRHCNIKDYGNIFPGHGGMMDRLDSVLFVSVLVYLYQSLMKW